MYTTVQKFGTIFKVFKEVFYANAFTAFYAFYFYANAVLHLLDQKQ